MFGILHIPVTIHEGSTPPLPNRCMFSINQIHSIFRHIAALTLLVAFMQLYLLLIRVVPNTPVPIYINMFLTVLKTYTFILLCYFAFILSFAYSFFLIFSNHDEKNLAKNNGTESAEVDVIFGNVGYSLVKTLTMFIGRASQTGI